MNISGFNNALERAMSIESNTQGQQVNALGNVYNDYDDSDNSHLEQFNKGLDIMDRYKNNQIQY